MSWQDIALGLLAIVSAGLGWFMRELWDAVTSLRGDLHALENDVRNDFARRDDVRDAFNDLLTALRRIEDKLDGKADK